jgi:curved DNA-binding protein CbpA
MTLKPSAQGSLAKTPFAHLLLYVEARKLTGTLAVWPDRRAEKSGQDRILFEAGQLIAMRPIEPAKTLYAALMPLFARAEAPYGFYEGQNLLGQTGVLEEPIDLHTLLSRGLRVHAHDQVMDAVLERIRGRDLRLRGDAVLDRLELNVREQTLIEPLRAGSATLDALIGAGALPPRDAKRTLYLLTLARVLEATEGKGSIPSVSMDSFPPQPLGLERKLTTDTIGDAPPPYRESDKPHLGSSPAAKSLHGLGTSILNRSAHGLLAAAANKSAHGLGASFVGQRLDGAVIDNDNSRSSKTAPPAPRGLSPLDEVRWTEIAKLYGRLDELTHYELLGVSTGASSNDVQTAYFTIIKRIHPDRLPPALAPLVRAAQVLFERMTEANEALSNAGTRADYDRAVAEGGGTRAAERTMRNVLEAAVEYQKAEILSRRKDYAQALELLRSAIGKSPDDADYHALYTWILHCLNPSLPAPLEEMLASVDRALRLNPRHERAHYYKGVVLKRLKRDPEALRHFRTAAELNPHNVDAAREVRLATMRRDSKPPAPGPGQGGVLSRLFKK